MTNKQTAQAKIEGLIFRFEDQYDSYMNSNYNETKTRRDFIDPFFKALGWDIDNEAGYAEAYREVIHEDKVKVSGAMKAPDYSFRLVGGKRLFFVEAKKPSVSVKEDIQSAYQVRRYGWSAKHPISIITDFEEFAIYDCTKKPKPTDKASVSRIKYLSFRDYIKEFDFIWDTFSKEQVLKGSFDKFLLSDTKKKGTATVDKDFLESLDRWRTYLAVNISWNNRNLDEDEINFVVQQTIDRIIFLRIAEDRSVEPYGTLKHAIKQGNLYQNLYELFNNADLKYNSGLFDFKKDKISKNVVIENKILRTIINELYYPECPYEFSVLSVEILGSAYEQFLGKVIRITPAHHAKIEEKPEVRKSGGVYYTPQYIVEYIVKNTVGKLIEGKAPKEISKIKILDPACGSGSFLIGAFQYLLDYHKDYYSDKGKPPKGKKDNTLTPDGHLTTAEKKRILLNNIFGVDLDSNAVEVTKLSLLIKCLEGETEASIQQQLNIWNERVLPTLDNNIKDGNSLIDTDFYFEEIDFGYEKKIKPFNWQDSFPNILSLGGFDIVIGNPPFIQLSSYTSTSEAEKKYLLSKYKSSMGRLNTFGFFTKRGIDLLKYNHYLGFIIPNTITTQDYYEELRGMILNSCKINTIVSFENLPFKDAVVENVILILQKAQEEKERNNTQVSIIRLNPDSSEILKNRIGQNLFNKTPKFSFNIHLDKTQNRLHSILYENTNRLGDYLEVNQAIALKSDRSLWVSDRKIDDSYKPLLVGGKNINRYILEWDGTYLKYDLKGIHSCKREDIFLTKEKILFRRVADKLIATLDTEKFYALHTIVVMNLKEGIEENIRFFLGLFNSHLLTYLYKITFGSSKTVFSEIGARQVKELPIKKINFKDKVQKEYHDDIVKNVDILLKLKKDRTDKLIPIKLTQIDSKISFFEKNINETVYKLYNLSTEEIKIVENKQVF
jgi:type I restriction-modification system DNA methylase subunit